MSMQLEHQVKQPAVPRQSTPILLLHGAWHAAWCYDLWADEFASYGYETHTFSLPAHGKSKADRPIQFYGVQDYVNALAQIVDSIKPTPYVVAHSLGGYILQRYLQNHTLPAAVLLCALPYFGAVPFFLRYLRAHPLRYLAACLTTNLHMMVNTPSLVREYLITDGAVFAPEQLQQRLQRESIRVALECAFPIRRLQTQTPLLVVAAEHDGIFPVREEKQMADKYRADFLLIPNQGHDLMIEQNWQQVAGNIRDWLAKQS